MMKYILSLIFTMVLAVSAMAQDTPKVTIDVFASQSEVKTGTSTDIAIRQNIIDGWHTYWVNAGDSGEPMSIIWNDIPNGLTISDLHHPTPKRISYDPLVNFGHEGAPIFLQTITIADDFTADNITLDGEAFWLVCEEICIPESQNISITIPVGDQGKMINQSIFNSAKMPEIVNWETSLSKQAQEVALIVNVPADLHNQMTDVELYPYDWGIIETTSQIVSDINDDQVIFTAKAADRDLTEIENKSFLIKTDNATYQVSANITGDFAKTSYDSTSLLIILIFAFMGGMILNLMPCVFPILSMKALSLVKLSQHEKTYAQKSGIAYTLGVIVSFILIAGILIALKGAGETIGWGFQLQNPYIVAGLATLLFTLGLNLMGLFEINGRFTSFGSGLTTGNTVRSSFFTGVLATLVATPCTAPFMASAIGYALTQSAFVSLLIFATLGFGLAFPYLLLSYIPTLQKWLPKPGAWMDTFKQALAWPMFASAIWLVWVLTQQAGDLAVIYILGLFLAIIFMVWFINKVGSKIWKIIVVALLAGIFAGYSTILMPKSDLNYEAFDQTKLDQILNENPDQRVFVNMTAAWCITCLVNERTSLSTVKVRNAFHDKSVLYMKGDWTNYNAEITKYLESHGRNGVPLYVFYDSANSEGKRPEPIILPQILTPDIILNTLERKREPE